MTDHIGIMLIILIEYYKIISAFLYSFYKRVMLSFMSRAISGLLTWVEKKMYCTHNRLQHVRRWIMHWEMRSNESASALKIIYGTLFLKIKKKYKIHDIKFKRILRFTSGFGYHLKISLSLPSFLYSLCLCILISYFTHIISHIIIFNEATRESDKNW